MNATLDKWNPLNEIDDVTTRMNRLFARMPWDGGREFLASSDWVPPCNVSEDATEYHVRVELPDMRKEDVHVRLENGLLTIEGERKEEKVHNDVKLHRRELRYGHFVRSFSVPEPVNESKVHAVFDKGMLDVSLTKVKAGVPRGREIPIS